MERFKYRNFDFYYIMSLENELKKVELDDSIVPNSSNYVRGKKEKTLYNFLYELDKKAEILKYSNKEIVKYIEKNYDIKFSKKGAGNKLHINYNTFRKVVGQVKMHKKLEKSIKYIFNHKDVYEIRKKNNYVDKVVKKRVPIVNVDKMYMLPRLRLDKGLYFIKTKVNNKNVEVVGYISSSRQLRENISDGPTKLSREEVLKTEGETLEEKIVNALNNRITAVSKVGTADKLTIIKAIRKVIPSSYLILV